MQMKIYFTPYEAQPVSLHQFVVVVYSLLNVFYLLFYADITKYKNTKKYLAILKTR